MFDRFTDLSKRAIRFARLEAGEFGASEICTEHILLGLLHDPDSRANRLFRLSVRSIEFRQQITAQKKPGAQIRESEDLPLRHDAKTALAYAVEESRRCGHTSIGTEHLLLGLLRVERSLAAKLLSEAGVELQAAREVVVRTELPPEPGSEVTARIASPIRKWAITIAAYGIVVVMLLSLLGASYLVYRLIATAIRR